MKKTNQSSSTKSTTAKSTFVDFDNARYVDQVAVMERSENDGVCPFCMEQIAKYHKEPIEWEGKNWIVTKNAWPYAHTKTHLLVILKQHHEDVTQLTAEEVVELFQALNWAIKTYQIPGGALAFRFGDTNYSAASVNHLHAHVIQPDIAAPDYAKDPVKFKIGKYKKEKANQ